MSKQLQINIKKVAGALLKTVPDRNRDIIARRFGLEKGKKETLESIGRAYSITRERVRQIEEATLAQLGGNIDFLAPQVQPYADLVTSILEEHGGIMRESELFKQFSGSSENNTVNASLVLLMSIRPQFKRSQDTDSMHAFWAISDGHVEKARESLATLTTALQKHSQPVHEAELHNFYREKSKNNAIAPKALLAYASLSKGIGRNIFGEVGLSDWPEVNPKGVRDKAYLVLKRAAKPLHFRDITSLINEVGFSNKKANVQTVHNELIKDRRFVLVGRGMYGLSQWGFKSGTVKDVLTDIIKESGPLTKEELVAKVLSSRFVKENTISLNLQDTKVFKRTEDGRYSLRQA